MIVNKLKMQYGIGFLLSVGIHAILIAMLFLSLHMDAGSEHPSMSIPNQTANANQIAPNQTAKGEIVSATMVDEKLVAAEMKRLETQEKQQKEEIHKAELAKKEREKEQSKLSQLKKELAKAKADEEARLAEIKLAKEKEQKQLTELRQEKEKEKKRLAALDDKRQEEQNRAEEMRLEREKEEKKQAEMKEKSDENKKAQSANRDAEKMRARKGFLNSELARYQGLLRDKVNQAWVRAPGLPQGLICMLEIRLLPDGSVNEVRVVTSSGNFAFDQAALAAVQKASPLPVPEDTELMDKFKHFTFEFRPPEAG